MMFQPWEGAYVCSYCPDRKRAQSKVSQAMLTLNQLERLTSRLQHKGYEIRRYESNWHEALTLCETPLSFSCYGCTKGRQEANELHQLTTMLSKQFYALGTLLHLLEHEDQALAAECRQQALRLASGHYPNAARALRGWR